MDQSFRNVVDVKKEEPILITESMLVKEPANALIDFEKGLSYFPRLTLCLILVNVVVFFWEVFGGALETPESLIKAGALYREFIFQGEVWRLLTAIFLHADGGHLIGNGVALYILGMTCEHALGFRQSFRIYFLSGLAGSALSICMNPGPGVGASGAIFGLMASVIVFFFLYGDKFLLRDKRIGLVLGVWAIYSIASGFLTPYIDNFAHIGGFIGGSIVAFFSTPKRITASAISSKS